MAQLAATTCSFYSKARREMLLQARFLGRRFMRTSAVLIASFSESRGACVVRLLYVHNATCRQDAGMRHGPRCGQYKSTEWTFACVDGSVAWKAFGRESNFVSDVRALRGNHGRIGLLATIGLRHASDRITYSAPAEGAALMQVTPSFQRCS